MPRRFLGTLVVVCALALVCAGSAAAASLTFDGRVLRYRADPRVDASVSVYGGRFRPEQLEVSVRVPEPDVGFGCDKDLEESDGLPERVAFVCPILVPFEQVRYRFVLSDRADVASGSGNGLRGVVYAGNGGDGVHEGDRVYGGRGDDSLNGAQLYGGPGDDSLYGILVRESLAGDARAAGRNVLYGGRGNDKLQAPGWLYGGPGDDYLSDTGLASLDMSDMLVGGPGRDVVSVTDDSRDVVRVRGGGTDRVKCVPGSNDVLFVDHIDRLSPGCKNATVLYTTRPRYPYP